MYCVRKVTDDIYWVGANEHRLHLFENIHPIPRGVSYNAYLLLDKKTALFDTVDWAACRQLLENLDHLLNGRPLDYLVINHMEPDHGASIEEVLLRYPDVTIISTEKSFMLICRRLPPSHGGKRGRFHFLWKTHRSVYCSAHGSLA